MKRGVKVGAVKFDCLHTDDDLAYEKAGIPVKKGLSGSLCPDHYFVSNIEAVADWGAIRKILTCLSLRVPACATAVHHISRKSRPFA